MTRIEADWLRAPPTQEALQLLESGGHQALLVGGCVRDALLSRRVTDLDIATDAVPDRVLALAKAAGIKAIPTGIDHGTITLVLAGRGFEVTTFRADIETDGRHARVRFSDRLETDAARRDFTMNALYADREGCVVDPVGGLADLRAGRVRFIGEPERRIAEDRLRVLRFFRFFAWYGQPDDGLDPDALAAIAEARHGLDRLSKERIGAEIGKLLSAPDPLMAVSAMERTGILGAVLPGASVEALGPLLHHEAAMGLDPDALRRLAALGVKDGAALRLSRRDSTRLAALHALIGAPAGLAEIAWRQGAAMARDVAVLRAASLGTSLPDDAERAITRGSKARFPVTAQDLMPALSGAALGAALAELETRWIASDFSLTREALLAAPRQG